MVSIYKPSIAFTFMLLNSSITKILALGQLDLPVFDSFSNLLCYILNIIM